MSNSSLILFPPDVEGIVAAAAAVRHVGPSHSLQALAPYETARRVYGAATAPEPPDIIVVDLVPTDSLESLLTPALRALADAGRSITWYLGRDEPAPFLQQVTDLVEVRSSPATPSWRLIVDGEDETFGALADAILSSGSEAAAGGWREVLNALSTSWDWTRLYHSVESLATLEPPEDEALAWAIVQTREVEAAEEAVRHAPVRSLENARMAIVDDPTIPARMRLEPLRDRRDVDVVAFVSGPGRLQLLATDQRDLSFLQAFQSLLHELEEGTTIAGSISGRRANLSWNPDGLPAVIEELVGADVFPAADSTEFRDQGLIRHDPEQRIAKGTDGDRLAKEDWERLRTGLSDRSGAPEPAPASPPGSQPPALENDLRLTPTHSPEADAP